MEGTFLKTVLVVENNKNQRLLYEQELRFEGYNVLLARNGREAIAKLKKQIPDLIIMEITMPLVDGIETISDILVKRCNIPIIINTAYGDYKDRFFPWSADACIVKSSDLGELKNKTKELLGKNV
jgi:CheY-like chemotaxis protein